ncbi:hypothetical protein [Halorussus sp. MSC15.2]|uniref:hypothetical protein n=1 Tax=Halorussus sp. MSC15.2 TaxID=2283638 RepID=UPI0013D4967C|nr:hypothetical protein [Halorussus sp. MSC15.2]NEU57399.1 hypothetical protein [Halorussus sp. MSC15.2]
MDEFRFDCAFCDVTVDAATAAVVKEEAKAHLEAYHVTELREVFAVAFGGNECDNDCGYVFPDGIDGGVEYECPTCGHDNFPPFLEQYVYWRIEKET